MSNFDLLIKIFENYYSQIYEEGYRLNTDKSKVTIDKFFKALNKQGYVDESIGHSFLDHFVLFQIEYWQDKEIERKPTLNWFIGTKAIERYFEVEDWSQRNYFISKNTKNLTPLKLVNEKTQYEEYQKSLYHNTEKGFFNCIENTSLYSKCSLCFTCSYRLDCKTLLKKNYPLLYKKRLN
jgi:hypothetical protein